MKEIVVVSGKGGTGKTSLVASFAALASKPVLADCDVDAADLHLVLPPAVVRREVFTGGKRAKVLVEKCNGCGQCRELCRFGAVRDGTPCDDYPGTTYSIDPIACEGCGVCAWFCPEEAIRLEDAANGEWFISRTLYGPMVHARLGIAEENSGKLVTLIRKEARRIAEEDGRHYVIVDGSPGIGCPVIASITGSDLVVVVTEPTVSGEHDLERVADLAKQLNVPAVLCVNKFDLNREMADRIEEGAASRGLGSVGNVRYDKVVTKAQTAKSAVVEYTALPISNDIERVWRNIVKTAGTGQRKQVDPATGGSRTIN